MLGRVAKEGVFTVTTFAAWARSSRCPRVRSLPNLVICIEHVVQSRMLVEIDQGLRRQTSWQILWPDGRPREHWPSQLMEQLQVVCTHTREALGMQLSSCGHYKWNCYTTALHERGNVLRLRAAMQKLSLL